MFTKILPHIHKVCILYNNGVKKVVTKNTEFEAWRLAQTAAKMSFVKKVAWTGSWVNWKWQIVKS